MSKKLVFLLGGLTILCTLAAVTSMAKGSKSETEIDDKEDLSYKSLGYDYDLDEDYLSI